MLFKKVEPIYNFINKNESALIIILCDCLYFVCQFYKGLFFKSKSMIFVIFKAISDKIIKCLKILSSKFAYLYI